MRKLVCIFIILLLQACKVHTLNDYDSLAQSKLVEIKLGHIDGKNPYRVKQVFYEEFYMEGDDVHKAKKYELYLKLSDSVGNWLIQSDSTILRKNLSLISNFSLKDLQSGKIIKSGLAKSIIIFSESPSAWSSYVSEEKAYENAVRDVLRSVRIQIALFLANYRDKDENKSKKHR